MRMKTVKKLMTRDENVAVVLMFRDPRGMVASRFRAGYVSKLSQRSKAREAQMICARMAEDYKV